MQSGSIGCCVQRYSHITRESGEALAKANAEDSATHDSGEEFVGANALQMSPRHDSVNEKHRPREGKHPADVPARELRTAVIRVQAFVPGVAAQCKLRASSAAATLVQGCVRGMRAAHDASCRFTGAAAVRVQPAAVIVVQSLWRGAIWREELFRKTMAAVIMQRWTRTAIVVRSLARTRLIARARGAHVLQFATVCVEFRFRSMCKLSPSASVYSRACRTAATLVQRRWTKVVKNASLAARCHVFREAELVLRSLVRRSQQTELCGVVRASSADRHSVCESADRKSASTKMTCLEAQEELWLIAAEGFSKTERSRVWGRSGRETIGDSPSSNDTDTAARQRSRPLASATEAGSSIRNGHRGTPRAWVTQTKPSSAPVSVSTASSDCLGENDRSSTPLNDALSKSDSTLTIRATSKRSEERHSVDRGSEDRHRIGHSLGQGNDRPGNCNSQRDQQVALLPQKSSITSATNAARLETSEQRNVANVGGQIPATQHAIVTAPKHTTTQGAGFTPPERAQTPRQAQTERPSAATWVAPPTRQLLSSTQLRALLNALMRTPVGVVQQVGFILMLFVSILETSLPVGGTPPPASTMGRAAGKAASANAVDANEEREQATKIVTFAKAKRARGNRFMGDRVKAGVQNVKAQTLRRWAVRRNQKVQQLLRLLQETTEVGMDDALLIEYHAGGIEPREAGKALSAAAAVLAFVTRVSGDAIAKSRTDAAVTNGFVEEIEGTVALQELDHHGVNAGRRPQEDVIPADVAEVGTCTASAIRVQSLARGVAARRVFRMRSATGAAPAAAPAATPVTVDAGPEDDHLWREAVLVQALWRGVMSRKALLCKTISAVGVQRSSSLGPEIELSSSSSSKNGSYPTSTALATEVTLPSAAVSVSTALSGSLSNNDNTSSLLGGTMLESDSSLAFRAESAHSKRRDSVDQGSEGRSGTGVSSGQASDRLGSSRVNTPGAFLAKQPDISSTMGAAITLPFCGNHAKGVGGPSPTLQQAMVTLDEAIVWPVTSSVEVKEVTALGAEELLYGGGQIIGQDGAVISIKSQVPWFSVLHPPSPPRRRVTSQGTSPPETPGSPDRPCQPTSPSTPPSLRRRRRREGSRSAARRLQSRSLSLSVFRIPTPPSSPDRLRMEPDSMSTSSRRVVVVDPRTKEGGSSQAKCHVPSAGPTTKKADVSSQADVETPASGLLVSSLPPAAANVGAVSRNTGRPELKWAQYGTCHLRRRPACSATGEQARLPVVQVRPAVCVQSKLRQEQFMPGPDGDDGQIDASPTVNTAGRPHSKSVTGWLSWRRTGDKSPETGVFPPARFRQFRTFPRYWCYLDYALSEKEVAMCAKLPAVLVGGGAGVLIADVVEEHGRAAVEIALERSVRNTFNGGSRHGQRVHGSPGELRAKGDSSADSSGCSAAAPAGAGPGKAAIEESTSSADVSLLYPGAFSHASVVDGDSGLAAQCGTSFQEQERALKQCRARQFSAPFSVPGMRGNSIPPPDAGTRAFSETNAEAEDSGLAALYGTSLQEQEKALALYRGRR